MGTSIDRDDFFDAIAAGLVEIGHCPAHAAEITEAIFVAANAAGVAAMLTIEGSIPNYGINTLPVQHTTLQVLIARLTAMAMEIEGDLLAQGAVHHDVPLGVDDHG